MTLNHLDPGLACQGTPAEQSCPFEIRETNGELKLAVKPTPRIWTLKILLFLALAGGFSLCLNAALDPVANHHWLTLAAIGFLTLAAPLLTIMAMAREQKRGPLLLHRAGEDTVALPRLRRRLALAEIASIAIVTGHHDTPARHTTELELRTRAGERLPLIVALRPVDFSAIVTALCARFHVPAHRAEEDFPHLMRQRTDR